MHDFADFVDGDTQGRLGRHITDGAVAVSPFDGKEGCAGQIRSSTGIEDADRRS